MWIWIICLSKSLKLVYYKWFLTCLVRSISTILGTNSLNSDDVPLSNKQSKSPHSKWTKPTSAVNIDERTSCILYRSLVSTGTAIVATSVYFHCDSVFDASRKRWPTCQHTSPCPASCSRPPSSRAPVLRPTPVTAATRRQILDATIPSLPIATSQHALAITVLRLTGPSQVSSSGLICKKYGANCDTISFKMCTN